MNMAELGSAVMYREGRLDNLRRGLCNRRYRVCAALVAGVVWALVAFGLHGIVTAIAGIAAAVAVWRVREPEEIALGEVEATVAHFLDLDSHVTIDGQSATAVVPKKAKGQSDFVREWVARVKERFGAVAEKDVLCVKRWLGEEIQKVCPDMRVTDRVKLIPTIAMLSTVPGEGEIMAEVFKHTWMVTAARQLGGEEAQ